VYNKTAYTLRVGRFYFSALLTYLFMLGME